MSWIPRHIPSAWTTAGLLLCTTCTQVEDSGSGPREEPPDLVPAAPVLKRLTTRQYANSISDIFGDEVVIARSLEPDSTVDGLLAVGASVASLSAWGVEQYEQVAFDIAEQVMDDPDLYGWFLSCEPDGSSDRECALQALDILGLHTWRRPLESEDLSRLADIAETAGALLGDFHDGMELAVAALLQSPSFLYRVELGESHVDGLRYTDWEMATRLSFLIWNTTPDKELLNAAENGELTEFESLAMHADRMLDDPRAYDGVRAFFSDMLGLYKVESLTKDTEVFPYWTPDVKPAVMEETLRVIEANVFEEDGDYRNLFTTRRTWVDRRLAALYGIPAPTTHGFGEVSLQKVNGRRGLMGHMSLLALNAHPVSTSVTLRGVFVREVLLCQSIPPPPVGVNTSIPEPSADARTMRDRVERHLEDPTCASCHTMTDLVGLGLENFDGIGLWRDTENETEIDASSELDNVAFDNAWQLGRVLSEHERLPTCLAETLYKYAQGRSLADTEADLIDWHTDGFADSGYGVRFLLRDMATSPGFRQVGEVDP